MSAKITTAWAFVAGCYERYDLRTRERVAFVNPEPGVPEWCWEITVDGAVVSGQHVEPDTREAACAAADAALSERGWRFAERVSFSEAYAEATAEPRAYEACR